MAVARPPFSYTTFQRLIRSCEPSVSRPWRDSTSGLRQPRAGFRSSAKLAAPDTQSHGYGSTAASGLPPPLPPKKIWPSVTPSKLVNEAAKKPEPRSDQKPQQAPDEKSDDRLGAASQGNKDAKDIVDGNAQKPPPTSIENLAAESEKQISQLKAEVSKSLDQDESKPVSTVLAVASPASTRYESRKHPHLEPPPYVHHFDTFTLVRDLEKGGFRQAEAVTLMKAVRNLLDENLHVAQDGLISKSDVENENYLFRAACSELRTTIQTSRASASQQQHTERAHLQHDVDILTQRMTQELATLKDEIKGMFNDRKMATRMEQKTMESKIQELNYKITVLLSGETKSHIEGLRWVITRRVAMTIASVFRMSLLTVPSLALRYIHQLTNQS
ncbi:MAG: hypothetical protein M1834_000359 [Cirrosporium novae-zelandiae]|nr:MAG: hypothetical protein M1834_000359 [Cirrosporium novae-zelandiae]